jgi:cytochrome c oxidase accessory protein FixG
MPSTRQSKKRPNLDSVTTINEDGSRYVLHPSDSHGIFTSGRRWFALLLLGIYIALPWIYIGGQPAVFLNLAERRFHLFGFTFLAQDAWLMFFVITGLAFSLFYVTALFGRLWCGWACPYTIFLEHVFRRIERLIEGDGPKRRALDNAPWTGNKIAKRGLKHAIFLGVSLLLSHIFLSYFVSLPGLYEMVRQAPMENLKSFAVVVFFTGGFYFCFGFFREQFCIIMCPYGRIQSALTDEHTMVVGYDEKRGEPRGRLKENTGGDCIDCLKCVQVCPTGIDIRKGLQIECVGCANCIDACDEIMVKVDRPKGLVRYDSLTGLRGGKTRWFRPRTYLYTALLCFGMVAAGLALTSLRSYEVSVTRMVGDAFYVTDDGVRNQFRLRLGNKTDAELTFAVRPIGIPEGSVLQGIEDGALMVPAYEEREFTFTMVVPRDSWKGAFPFELEVTPDSDSRPLTRELRFAGPPNLPPTSTATPATTPTQAP